MIGINRYRIDKIRSKKFDKFYAIEEDENGEIRRVGKYVPEYSLPHPVMWEYLTHDQIKSYNEFKLPVPSINGIRLK